MYLNGFETNYSPPGWMLLNLLLSVIYVSSARYFVMVIWMTCNYIKTYFYPIQISFTVYDNGYYSYTAAWLKIKNPWRAWGLLGVYFKINVIIYRVFQESEPYQIYVFNGIFFLKSYNLSSRLRHITILWTEWNFKKLLVA